MSQNNPRYPFSVTVKRPKVVSGEVVQDNRGDVTYEAVALSIVALDAMGYMMRTSGGVPIIASTATSICCGYRVDSKSTADAGAVAVHDVILHTPPFTTELLYGDILEITDYDRTYRAKVVKKMTYNMGSAIWADEIKN